MKKILQYLLIAFVVNSTMNAQNNSTWTRINLDKNTVSDRNNITPNSVDHLFFKFDDVVLRQSLLSLENKVSKINRVEILIPNKNGKLERFSVWESSNFEPELQAKYPEIRAYAGVGITDKKASINFSLSPKGIQTMILRADEGSEFIELYAKEKNIYVLFDSKNRNRGSLPFSCKTEDLGLNKKLLNTTNKISANNGVFKTLRLALSCTGEYTAFHGGTIPLALAAMNATMTRVNGVFNKDLAVKLQIIGNNTSIIYTDAATDPYSDATVGLQTIAGCNSATNDCPGNWNNELQTTLTTVIGEVNYDIGHLFGASGGGGNAGCIGCVCDPLRNTNSTPVYSVGKGGAFTSPSDAVPQGDSFDIDFVAHEMGHQLGANHTFSFDGTERTGVNVEPGSGSTIMGYAGITANYDVQSNSDDYFAYTSISQIQNNLLTKSCPINTTFTNSPPVISAGLDYTIPYGTAFKLIGTGSDVNGDTVSYCWEQNDTAIAQSGADSFASPTKINGPNFRSLYPSEFSFRYMPSQGNVLANRLTTAWESVSSVARTLHFTLTGRDNATQGTAQTNTDEMIVNVSGTTGPFAVTSQNTDDLSWIKGSSQTITWSVNGSNALGGSTNVNIKLSTDGGLTFSTTLVSNTPNDGSETINAPNISAKNCRILIEPTANIYYAVNSKAFAIGYSVTSSCTTYAFGAPFNIPDASTISKTINVPASTETIVDVNFAVSFSHKYLGDVQLEVISPLGTIVKLFDRSCGASDSSLVLNYDDAGGALACGTITAQTVAPFEPLAAFNGQNKQGFWIFRASDAEANDIGKVDSASITICTQSFTLATPEFEIDDFVLYPNPNKGNFNVQLTSTSSNGVKVLVHDLLGRKLFENEFKNKSNFNENIQLKNAQPGVYLLTVIDGNRKDVRKIVIE
jgi:subtilisin-like proprotein convertase family protein